MFEHTYFVQTNNLMIWTKKIYLIHLSGSSSYQSLPIMSEIIISMVTISSPLNFEARGYKVDFFQVKTFIVRLFHNLRTSWSDKIFMRSKNWDLDPYCCRYNFTLKKLFVQKAIDLKRWLCDANAFYFATYLVYICKCCTMKVSGVR